MQRNAIALVLVALVVLPVCASDVEVWSADKRIESPVELHRKGLRIESGVHVTFVGEGTLLVQDAAVECRRVTFEAEGTLTNRFRICVLKGKADFQDCEFRGISSFTPAGAKMHWIEGGICVNQGSGSHFSHCTFSNCSPVMVMSSHDCEIDGNLCVGGNRGFSLLQCRNARIAANEFWGMTDIALKVSHIKDSDLFMNRFTCCATGVRLSWCSKTQLSGNAFFDCETGFCLCECGTGIVENGNRFENVKSSKKEKEK